MGCYDDGMNIIGRAWVPYRPRWINWWWVSVLKIPIFFVFSIR
jgi:hypothetical protein